MTDSDVDELGPVDYIVVEFPADQANFSGEMASELSALIKRGLVRVLDLLFLKNWLSGSGPPRGLASSRDADRRLPACWHRLPAQLA